MQRARFIFIERLCQCEGHLRRTTRPCPDVVELRVLLFFLSPYPSSIPFTLVSRVGFMILLLETLDLRRRSLACRAAASCVWRDGAVLGSYWKTASWSCTTAWITRECIMAMPSGERLPSWSAMLWMSCLLLLPPSGCRTGYG